MYYIQMYIHMDNIFVRLESPMGLSNPMVLPECDSLCQSLMVWHAQVWWFMEDHSSPVFTLCTGSNECAQLAKKNWLRVKPD